MIHVPALMQDAWGISRSSGRIMLAKGSVSLDGVTIGLNECDIDPAVAAGSTLEVKGHGKAFLTGDHASRPMPMVECAEEQLLMGGL